MAAMLEHGRAPHAMGNCGGYVFPPGRPKEKCGPLGGQGATRSGQLWGLYTFVLRLIGVGW